MRKACLILLACFGALSCNSCHFELMKERKPVSSSSCPADGPVLETLTYNVGLAPGVVSMATPRIAPAASEIAKFRDVGIMCFQELWTDEARDAVVSALALPPENVYYVETEGQGDDLTGVNVCTRAQIEPVARCVRERCSDVPDEERTLCAHRECRSKLIELHGLTGSGRDCLNCLVASVGRNEDDIVRDCTDGTGVSHAYGGRNGVLLVSHWPLTMREAMTLPSSNANRVALFATVEIDGLEPIEVACTHVSTWNELPPSHRDARGRLAFKDWDEEMTAQVDMISRRLAERAGSRPQLFMGDMNAGPEIGNDVAVAAPDVWSALVRRGFDSPAARAAPPFCSTCPENTLRDSSMGYLIDHVLVRDPPGGTELDAACARPVFDQRRVFRGYDGRWTDSHLSDHFGTAVTFTVRTPP